MQSYVSMAELPLAAFGLATRPIWCSYFALYLTLLLLLEGMYPPYVSLLMDVLENFSLDSPNTSGGLYRLRYRLQRKERKNKLNSKRDKRKGNKESVLVREKTGKEGRFSGFKNICTRFFCTSFSININPGCYRLVGRVGNCPLSFWQNIRVPHS